MTKIIVAIIVASLASSAFAEQSDNKNSEKFTPNVGATAALTGRHTSAAWMRLGVLAEKDSAPVGMEGSLLIGQSTRENLVGLGFALVFPVTNQFDVRMVGIAPLVGIGNRGFGWGSRINLTHKVAVDLNLLPFALSRKLDWYYANAGLTYCF